MILKYNVNLGKFWVRVANKNNLQKVVDIVMSSQYIEVWEIVIEDCTARAINKISNWEITMVKWKSKDDGIDY